MLCGGRGEWVLDYIRDCVRILHLAWLWPWLVRYWHRGHDRGRRPRKGRGAENQLVGGIRTSVHGMLWKRARIDRRGPVECVACGRVRLLLLNGAWR